jgi:hypothetical protein
MVDVASGGVGIINISQQNRASIGKSNNIAKTAAASSATIQR